LRVGLAPPLRGTVYFCLFNMLWTWVASLATGNVSQVDRVWTFLPLLYTAWYTFYPTFESAPLIYKAYGVSDRAFVMFALQALWMFRLSYNTWRRGLFSLTDEDYRWQILRRKFPTWFFQIINLVFIVIIQNILLFMLGLPAYRVLVEDHSALGASDFVLTILAFTTLAIEFTADNQQWSYQNFKHSGKISDREWPGANIEWTENDRKRGFVTRGLWAWTRHPNFACEQTFWIIQSLFPILSSPKLGKLSPENLTPLWPLVPALSLCALFYASTQFSESISKAKYPVEYGAYQSRVGKFSPTITLIMQAYHTIRGQCERLDELVWGEPTKKD